MKVVEERTTKYLSATEDQVIPDLLYVHGGVDEVEEYEQQRGTVESATNKTRCVCPVHYLLASAKFVTQKGT